MSDEKEFEELVEQIFSNNHKQRQVVNHDELAETASRLLDEIYLLKERELITWKPKLRNRGYPNYNTPAVLVRRLPKEIENPIVRHGIISGNDVVDIEIAVFDDDGDLMLFFVDSRRMMPWNLE